MVMNQETIADQLRDIVRHIEAGQFESVDSDCGALLGDLKGLFTPVRNGSTVGNSFCPLMWHADYLGYDRVSHVARQVATVRCTLSAQNLTQALSNAKAALARWEQG